MSDEEIRSALMLVPEAQRELVRDEHGSLARDQTIAILKRQLELYDQQCRQSHYHDYVSIQTERAGRGLKISWSSNYDMQSGGMILGYRKTGGFSPIPSDLESHGALVIEGWAGAGHVTEFLNSGETYFYTFLLKTPKLFGSPNYYRLPRFQVTMISEMEIEAIAAAIRKLEETKPVEKPDPDKEGILAAMRKLKTYRDFDAAFETLGKRLEQEIAEAGYTDAEKEDKIGRLRAVMAIIREEHEPI
jgi:hypothetical protein